MSHNNTGQATSATGRRTTLTQFVGVCCIDMSNVKGAMVEQNDRK